MKTSLKRVRQKLEKATFSGRGVEICDDTYEALRDHCGFLQIPDCLFVQALIESYFEALAEERGEGARLLGLVPGAV